VISMLKFTASMTFIIYQYIYHLDFLDFDHFKRLGSYSNSQELQRERDECFDVLG
jgi:hypothetical protein